MENIPRVSRDGMKERARDEIKSVATAKKILLLTFILIHMLVHQSVSSVGVSTLPQD